MKIKYLFIVFISLFFVTNVSAQNIKGVLIFGGNLTQVDGDEIYGFKKLGFNLGAAAIMPLNEKQTLNISVETLFSQKGSYQKYPFAYDTTDYPYYNLNLNYLEVPILFQYTDKKIISFEGGFSWGRLVSLKEIEHGSDLNWSKQQWPYSREDWNLVAGLRFRIHNKWHLNVRYAYSFKKIRTRAYTDEIGQEWERNQYNNVITFRLYYILNDSYKSPKQKKDKN